MVSLAGNSEKIAPGKPSVALTYIVDAESARAITQMLDPGAYGWADTLDLPLDWESLEQARDFHGQPRIMRTAPFTVTHRLSEPYSAVSDCWLVGFQRGWLLLFESGSAVPEVHQDAVVLLMQLQGRPQDWVATAQVFFDPGVHIAISQGDGGLVAHLGAPADCELGTPTARITRKHTYPLTSWWIPRNDTMNLEPDEMGRLQEWPSRLIRKQPSGEYAPVTQCTRPSSLIEGDGGSVVIVGDTSLCLQRRANTSRLITFITADVQVAAAMAVVRDAQESTLASFRSLRATDSDAPVDEVRDSLRGVLAWLRQTEDDLALSVRPVVASASVAGGVFAVDYAQARGAEVRLADLYSATVEALSQIEGSIRLRRDDLELRDSRARQEASDKTLKGLRDLLDTGSQVRLVASVASVFLVLLSAASLFAALGSFPRDDVGRWLGSVSNVYLATSLGLSLFMGIAVGLVHVAGQGREGVGSTVTVGLVAALASAALFGSEIAKNKGFGAMGALGTLSLVLGVFTIALLMRRREGTKRVRESPQQGSGVLVECVLAAVDNGTVAYSFLPREPLEAGQDPTERAQGLVNRAGLKATYLHSTSWRQVSDGVIVLTYLALVPQHSTQTWHSIGAMAYEPAREPPTQRDVAAHGLRHVALLIKTDPKAAGQLEGEWTRLLASWPVLGAGQLPPA